MSENFEPRDDLTERLSALGRHPVSPALQSEHLTAMAGVARGASWRSMLASRVKLGAAVLGGFLIGTTGLASAGAMGPLQPIAKTTVEAVTPFELPDSANEKAKAAVAKAEAKAAKRAAQAAKPDDGDDDEAKEPKFWAAPECMPESATITHRNRGQYLKSVRALNDPVALKAAQESRCGKSLNADGTVDDDDTGEDETNKPDDDDDTDDQGKSGDKRQDDDDADDDKSSGNAGKSGVAKVPSTDDDDDDTPDTPDAPDAPDAPDDSDDRPDADDNPGTDNSGSGSSNSGSDKSGRTDS